MLEGIYCGRESPIYHYQSQVIKINGQKIIKMISLFIVLSCSWGNPTLKGSAGVLKMGIWSPWRLLWVNLPYDKKQKIKIVFKLPKLLKTIFFSFCLKWTQWNPSASMPKPSPCQALAAVSESWLPWLLLAGRAKSLKCPLPQLPKKVSDKRGRRPSNRGKEKWHENTTAFLALLHWLVFNFEVKYVLALPLRDCIHVQRTLAVGNQAKIIPWQGFSLAL